ncbi:hypothetical protein L1887_16528 [Cichorium endivia]|nr:hypothetical protein L1887_16528 [Cichorium endivia]
MLTFPIGAIMKLLAEETLIGRLRDLYQSIENLNDMYILQNKSKDTILNPTPSNHVPHQDLLLFPINLPATIERKFYKCSVIHRCRYVTDEPKAVCPNCRFLMSDKVAYVAMDAAKMATMAATCEVGLGGDLLTKLIIREEFYIH